MTRRSNRKDKLRLPYHINLPLELRLRVYHHLFYGMICPGKPYPYWGQNPPRPHRCKELELRKLSILRVSKATREEALPIFEKNIIVVLDHPDQFRWVQRSCRQAQTLRTRTWSLTKNTIEDGFEARNLNVKLPALKRVECHLSHPLPMELKTVENLITRLNGSRDDELLPILETQINKQDRKLKDSPYKLTVFMSFTITYLPYGWSSPKVSWLYRVALDVENWKTTGMTINLGGSGVYIDMRFEPADEVMVVREGLEMPILLHSPTQRQLMPYNAKTEFINVDELKKRMDRALSNKAVRDRALASAVSCARAISKPV